MTPSDRRILIVDDEPIKRTVLEDQLREAGYDVAVAANPLEAEPLVSKNTFDVILTDLRMPGEDGLTFLRNLRESRPEQSVIVMTAYGTVETAVEAMKLGAFDYLQKPFSTEELLLKLDRLMRYTDMASENRALKEELARPLIGDRIVGHSPAMREVLARIHAVGGTDTTILIAGESGTGKEMVARMLHKVSHRSGGPYVAVSCAALPRGLIESELFGHEAGAFTGATKRRIGRFECAHGGTLFLDDVDDIPLDIQVKLLRVLQEHIIQRVGGQEQVRTNVRIIAATKKALSQLVAEGKFREDLYYRLSVVPVHLPPLRDRRDDIPLLINHFLEKLTIRLNRSAMTIAPEAVRRLQAHTWPGNVRELEHVIERMIVLSETSRLQEQDVPEFQDRTDGPRVTLASLDKADKVDMTSVVAELESQLVRWALARSEGNLARAADILGIPRSTLQYKVGKLPEPPAGGATRVPDKA